MKYFMIEEDKSYLHAPRIINSYSLIDSQRIKKGEYGRLKKRTIFRVMEDSRLLFTDIVCHPFFLVSSKIRDCLCLFEPNLSYKEIILLNQKGREAQEYFLPMLKTFDAFIEKDSTGELRVDFNQVGDCSIFILIKPNARHVVARLDVVESILRRGHRGFLVTEMKYRIGGTSNGGY